jgi:hypothetical protein
MMNAFAKKTIDISVMIGMTICLAAGQEKAAPAIGKQAAPAIGKQSVDGIDCSGQAKACTKPVKFLSRTPSCVCFTCAYGTPDSRPMCTKNRSDAKSMASLAHKSGNGDQQMDHAVATLGTKDWEYSEYGRNHRIRKDDPASARTDQSTSNSTGSSSSNPPQ